DRQPEDGCRPGLGGEQRHDQNDTADCEGRSLSNAAHGYMPFLCLFGGSAYFLYPPANFAKRNPTTNGGAPSRHLVAVISIKTGATTKEATIARQCSEPPKDYGHRDRIP